MSTYEKNGKYYCRFQVNGERHHYKCNGATSIKEAQKIENQYIYKVQQQQNGHRFSKNMSRWRRRKMKETKANITIYDYPSYYPIISDKLIECLKKDFPNQLPKMKISEFELGILVGNQQVIDKLIYEKERNENRDLED